MDFVFINWIWLPAIAGTFAIILFLFNAFSWIKRTDHRFEQIDARFEQVDARFEQIDRRLDEIKGQLSEFVQEMRADREAAENRARADRDAAERRAQADRDAARADREAARADREAAENRARADREAARREADEERREWRQENRATNARIDHTFDPSLSGNAPANARSKTGMNLLEEGSELKVTEKGQRIFDAIDAEAAIEKCVEELRSRVVGLHRYHIQEGCFHYAENIFEPDAELEERILTVAYENSLQRHDVLDVFAVVLRDRLIAEQG